MHIEAFLTLIWMDFSGVRFEVGGGGGGGGGGGVTTAKNQHFLAKVVSLFKIMVWELC